MDNETHQPKDSRRFDSEPTGAGGFIGFTVVPPGYRALR